MPPTRVEAAWVRFVSRLGHELRRLRRDLWLAYAALGLPLEDIPDSQ